MMNDLLVIQSAVRWQLESEYCEPGLPIKVWHEDPVREGDGWSYTARMFYSAKYDETAGVTFFVEYRDGSIVIREVNGPVAWRWVGQDWQQVLDAATEVLEQLRSQPELYCFGSL